MPNRRIVLVAATAIALLMVVSSMGLLAGLTATRGTPGGPQAVPLAAQSAVAGTTHPAPAAFTSSTHEPVAPGAAAVAKLQAAIAASHVDVRKVYPPNLVYAPTMKNGMIVTPSYPQAPEPAGMADYGVMNSTGTPSSFTIDTTSYRAAVDLQSVTPYYLANGVPEGFTSQLNVVLNNVTVLGQSSYTYWAQDVFFYDAYSSQLFVENNIWNFSAPAAGQLDDVFLTNVTGYTNGTNTPSVGYYAAGTPTFDGVMTPFTIVFYINATTYNSAWGTNYTEVNFAFDLLNATGAQVMSDQYDRILFNNTGGSGPIPQAQFHVDGTNITPTGYIPYDAEVMLGGPGGGSTATFQAINATMTLQHWNEAAGAYVNEPSAWSSGSETGETCVGIAEYYDSSDTVHLGAGPEFIQPFWNSSNAAAAGAAVLSGTISPSNSWTFVTNGPVYDISNSAWGALPVSGDYVWNLTQGTYVVKVMESDSNESISSALAIDAGSTTTYSVSLVANASMGVYTPLYAWSNSQLAAISTGGTGTVSDPYMIVNNEVGNLSGEFASMNDYAFPSYPGISFVGTTAYTEIANPATFLVDFWGTSLGIANFFGLPNNDTLSIWLFETSHVSIVGGAISGWFSANLDDYFPFANVLVWNSTSTLVTGVTFYVSVDAIFAFGGTGNSFVGNTFLSSPVPGAIMVSFEYPEVYYGLSGITGIVESESGDSIWNNYFATPITAFESSYNVFDDLYPTASYEFANDWNLSAAIPASAVTVINGISITGSPAFYPFACGNWWYDYAPGVTPLPYAEVINTIYGPIPYIETGGDYCPAGSLGTLVFTESGLPTGTSWSVTVTGPVSTDDPVLSGTSASLQAILANGTYNFTVGAVTGYAPSVSSGSANVELLGGVTTVAIVFTSTAATTGTIAGTVTPSSATVLIDGTAVTVTSGAFSKDVSVGVHSVETLASDYYAYFNNVSVAGGATTTVTIVLNPVTPPVGADGTLSLTVTPASATAWVDGTQVTQASGAYSASATPGIHSIVVSASGYYTYYNNVTVTSGQTTAVSVSLNSVSSSSSSSNTGISNDAWIIIGVLAALLLVVLILALLMRGRRGPATNPPAEAWKSVPPTTTAPAEPGKGAPPNT
jgi:thermopsin